MKKKSLRANAPTTATATATPSFIDILNNPEARKMVEEIEYMEGNIDLVTERNILINDLLVNFNYTYQTS